jgi:hypothetical protein
MPIWNGPFSVLETLAKIIPIAFLFVFFLWQLRRRPKRRRFRASFGSLGNALQQIQALAVPQIEYSLEEQRREKTDEDDEGGPDDPMAYYRRKMKEVDDCGGECDPSDPQNPN